MNTKTLFRLIVSLLVLMEALLPTVAIAQTGCLVTGDESVAGIGTEIRLSGCTPSGSIPVSITGPIGNQRVETVKTDAQGNGSTIVIGKYVQSAGRYRLKAEDATGMFSIQPASVDENASSVIADTDQIAVNGKTQITVELNDQYGNPIDGRSVILLGRKNDKIVSDLPRETDAQGRQTFTFSSSTNGISTITAFDLVSNRTIGSAEIQVGTVAAPMFEAPRASIFNAQISGVGGEFGNIASFDVKVAKEGSVKRNELFSVTVTARDASGNIVEDYVGTVYIDAPTDPDADYPNKGRVDPKNPSLGQFDFRPSDLGVRSIPLGIRFSASGVQTMTFKAATNQQITGTLTVQVTNDGLGGGDIQVLDPAPGVINTPNLTLKGKGPPLINFLINGALEKVAGETNVDGFFSVDVKLDPEKTNHTLFIVSESGQYQSDAIYYTLDQTGSAIEAIRFSPDPGTANEAATISITSEAGLKSVIVEINDQKITLTEQEPGIYTGEVKSDEAGTFDVRVTSVDKAGNETQMLAKWVVDPQGVPPVANVKAESLPQAVKLTWDLITDSRPPISGYKIYVAKSEEPTNYLYVLDVANTVNTATIRGLTSGQPYMFALTAINEKGMESEEKSENVEATPTGLKVTVIPGVGSLSFEVVPPDGFPLLKYALEYGVEAETLTESKTVNPAQILKLADLIDGVEYFVRITPIAVNGKLITEFSTTVSGVPSGEGFHSAPSEEVEPFEDPSDEPDLPIYEKPIETPQVGIPSVIIFSATIIGLLCAFATYSHRKQKLMIQSFTRMMDGRYRS